MDLYFCDGLNQIYSGRFNLDAMYEHITDSGLICCCNDSIYVYYKNEGRYIKIDKQNEWHVISSLRGFYGINIKGMYVQDSEK